MEHLDRPILENGVQYDLEPEEMLKLEGIIYFCEECNAFHVKEDRLGEFNAIMENEQDSKG